MDEKMFFAMTVNGNRSIVRPNRHAKRAAFRNSTPDEIRSGSSIADRVFDAWWWGVAKTRGFRMHEIHND